VPDPIATASSVLAIAQALQRRANKGGMGPPATPSGVLPDPLAIYDLLVVEPVLRESTRRLFADGHYSQAVEEAFKCLNNVVKERSGSAGDGASLMTSVFSLNSPVLKLNRLQTDSQRNQQNGYMQILAGCMTGIRNPRAHEHQHPDEPHVAIEMLALANHLMRLVAGATKSRKKKP
jgi:uncharacterized protein (TIGR02391 family)